MKLLVIPDTQVKPGVNTDHLEACGNYIKEKRPDVVIHLGDHWDMPSLSSYDRGKRAFEGRRVYSDIAAGNAALERLSRPFKKRGYTPRTVLLRGNHEERLERFTNDHPELEGTLGYDAFNDRKLGWEPIPFLKVITIGGIQFSHFFPRSADGEVYQSRHGAANALTQLRREFVSSIAGHKPGLQSTVYRRRFRSIIAGSFYSHKEHYKTPQGEDYWRGVLLLHEVNRGSFNLCEVSLDYLVKNYG